MKNKILGRVILFILVCIVLSVPVYSQDLIVTYTGDSINCKISAVKEDMVFFAYKFNDDVRNTLIPISQVNYYQYKFYQSDFLQQYKFIRKENYSHLKMEVYGGWSYWISRLNSDIPPIYSKYKKNLRTGYHFGGEITYYITEPLGFGIKYTDFKTRNKLDSIVISNSDGSKISSRLEDNVSVTFLGVFLSTRWANRNKRNYFLLNMGIGYLGYYDNKVFNDSYSIRGNTAGTSFDFAYELGIYRDLGLTFKISYTGGFISSYTMNDGISVKKVKLDDNSHESMRRIDLSIGIRFNSSR
jgi:hypothetical protein